MKVQPWGADVDDAFLADVLSPALGEPISAVFYEVPAGGHWPDGHRSLRVHEVDQSVWIRLGSNSWLVFSWAMDGLREGLAVELTVSGMPDSIANGDLLDVSSIPDWMSQLGGSIVGIAVTWHVPNEGCPEMPWSFRLDLSNGSSVVIALGEADGSAFAYSPDSLLVFFDSELARGYRIPASSTSSFG
ncbi:hypothetical protein [Agromyces sp. NPDC049794]|uniref:hypothetical protein n=1 Tax=unclassified Agromyces TaxID=2639701 RepID=UPI0033FBBF4D